MVLDTSALIAILLGEPEAEAMLHAIAADDVRLVGAPTLVEAAAVMHARKGHGLERGLVHRGQLLLCGLPRGGGQVDPLGRLAGR